MPPTEKPVTMADLKQHATPADLHVNPLTGERRLRLKDVRPPAETRQRVTLAQIIMQDERLNSIDANKDIYISPLNVYGLSLLEARFGSLEAIPVGLDATWKDKLGVVTCLVNQDLDEHKHMTEAEVGRCINGENTPLIEKVLEDVVRPLAEGAARKAEAAMGRPAGPASPSGASSASAAAPPETSGDSPTAG